MARVDISDVETRAEATSSSSMSAVSLDGLLTSGQSLGRYVILEQIGRGAFGRVLRAYDSKLEREVALKVLERKALDGTTQARVVREAQTMAKLSHPSVVAVYDVEHTAVGVMLVMEYVRGRTLRAWLREEDPDRAQTLARFCEAGWGLAAAHTNEILHLDFKPSNVLVPESGQAKVADFGIARFVPGLGSQGSSLVSQDMQVGDGELSRDGAVVGTPRYMAPEQHDGEELLPATDQYAFCVSLWEALADKPPFSAPLARLAALKRHGPPPWPEGQALPRPIIAALRRGLSADPTDRWPTMAALLRILEDEPARRRRVWVTVAGGVALLGVGGLGTQLWREPAPAVCTGAAALLAEVWGEPQRAQMESSFLATDLRYAAATAAWVQDTLDGYGHAWGQMHTETCEATTVRGEQSATVMDLRMACLERARQALGAAAEVLTTADPGVVERAHPIVEKLPALARCADAEALQADELAPPAQERDAIDHARAALARASAQRSAGRYEQAQASLEQATTALEGSTWVPIAAELGVERGALLTEQGEYPAAEEILLEALQTATRFRRWSLMRRAVLELMQVVGDEQARPVEAMRYRELALGLSEDDPRSMVATRVMLGQLWVGQGDYTKADEQLRLALQLEAKLDPPDPSLSAEVRNNLAIGLFRRSDLAQAIPFMREAVTLECDLRESEHPACLDRRRNLASMLMMKGEYAEAEEKIRALIALEEQLFGPSHPRLAASRMTLAVGLRRRGKPAEAEGQLREVLEIQLETFGPDHPQVAMTYNNLANTLRDRGLHDRAEQEDRRALGIRLKTLPPDHPDIASARGSLGDSLRDQGKAEEAMVEYRASLTALEKSLGAEHPRTMPIRESLAVTLLEQKRPQEALPLAEKTYAITQKEDVAPTDEATASFTLAQALWETEGDRARAVQLAQQARQHLEGGMPTLIEEVDTWLRDHAPQASPRGRDPAG